MYHHKQVFLLVAYLPFVQLQMFFAWIWAIIVHISMFSFIYIYIYVCLHDSSISQIQVHWCDVGKVNFQPLQVNHLQGGSDHRPVKLDVLSSCLNGLHYVSDLELIVGVNRLWGRCIFLENGLALFPLKDWYYWTSLHFPGKVATAKQPNPKHHELWVLNQPRFNICGQLRHMSNMFTHIDDTAQVLLRLSVKVDEPVASKPMEPPTALVEAVAQEDADSEGGETWHGICWWVLVKCHKKMNHVVSDDFLMGFRVLLHDIKIRQ